MVGNLRNVVSRFFVLACGASLLSAPVAFAQQAPPAAATPAAAPAVQPPAAAPAAAPEAEAKPEEKTGGQIRSKIEYAEPVLTKADEKATRSRLQVPLSRAQKAIAPTAAEKKTLEEYAQFSVDRITMTEFRSDLYRAVIEPAQRAAQGQLTTPAAKVILLKAMNDRCVALLAQNPPHHPDVQLGLAILMTSMNADTPTNKTPVPYVTSYKSVIALLDNTAIPLQCRIQAASGLGRMVRDTAVGVANGDLSNVQRNEISVALAKALLATDSAGDDEGKQWYRARIAESLGDCGQAFDLNGSSAPIDALMTVASNPKENLRVRATALRAATQTAWNAQTNVLLITHEALKLLVDIGNANNAAVAANVAAAAEAAAAAKAAAAAAAKAPASKSPLTPAPKAPAAAPAPTPSALPADLQHANLELYFCFQPKTAAQVTLKYGLRNQVTRPGLTQYAPLVEAAYAVAMPVINHILTKAKTPVLIPKVTLDAVDIWLKANTPTDRKVTPVSPLALP